MEKWFLAFEAEQAKQCPWMVKYETEDGITHEDQLAGENAQDVVDYVRKINGNITMIYFVAKLDNNWA